MGMFLTSSLFIKVRNCSSFLWASSLHADGSGPGLSLDESMAMWDMPLLHISAMNLSVPPAAATVCKGRAGGEGSLLVLIHHFY